MKTSTHQANNNHFLMVEVPEGYIPAHYKIGDEKIGLVNIRLGNPYDDVVEFTLPPGEWKLIGLASDLTEEQAEGIAESAGPFYKKYGTSKKFTPGGFQSVVDSALKSIKTLCQSKEMNPNTTVILQNK